MKKQPQEITAPQYGYGFIAQQMPAAGQRFINSEVVCLAIVYLEGEQLEKYLVDGLFLFPCSPAAVATKALEFNLRMVAIDESNYNWIRPAWNNAIDKEFNERPDRRGKLPSLRGVERNPDPTVRQLTVLQEPLSNGRLSMSSSITDAQILNVLGKLGESIVPDALAGAIETADDQRDVLLSLIKSANRPAEPMLWHGMKRWNWKD